jgi:hypothetical protein
VNVDALLDGLLGAAVELSSLRPLSPDEQAAADGLELSREVQQQEGVVCVALRQRREAEAADLLTLALPEPIVLGGEPALERPVRFGSEAEGDAGIFRSHVQILAPIEGASGSALLTLLSTEADVRLELEEVGAAVAESIKVSGPAA